MFRVIMLPDHERATIIAHELRCAWCGVLLAPGAQPIRHAVCVACCAEVFGFVPETQEAPSSEVALLRGAAVRRLLTSFNEEGP
jgi:hypothetical protein